jgi:hypothetical protein
MADLEQMHLRISEISEQRPGIGFLGPGSIPALYRLLSTFCAAREVGHVLYALHLMLKDIVAGKSRGPPEIKAFAKLVIFRLDGALQYHPVSGKKYGQSGQGQTAPTGTINIF